MGAYDMMGKESRTPTKTIIPDSLNLDSVAHQRSAQYHHR